MSLFAGILPAGAEKEGTTKLFSTHNKLRRGDIPASALSVQSLSDVGKPTGMEAGGSVSAITEGQPTTGKKQMMSREQPASERLSKKQKRQAGQDVGTATKGALGTSPGGEGKPVKKVKKKLASALESAEEHGQLAARGEAPSEQPEVSATEIKAKKRKKAREVESISDLAQTKKAKTKAEPDLTQSKRAKKQAEPNREVGTKRGTIPPAGQESKKPKKSRKFKPAADGEAELEHIFASEGLTTAPALEEQPAAQGAPAAQDADADEAEEPAQVRRTAEEEAARLQQTIFVGNLPATTKRKRLHEVFSKYGAVDSIRLRSVPVKLDKKLPRRAAILSGRISSDRGTAHAYIVFKDAASVGAALAHNMQEVDGLHVRVDRAAGVSKDGAKGSVEYDRTCSVFVGNLPFDVEDEEVIRVFNDVGTDADAGTSTVAAVRVVRDPETNLGKGFAFVLFTSKNAARMALARDGTQLRKRPIRVTKVAVPGRGAAARSTRGDGSAKGAERTSQLGRILPEPGALRRIRGTGSTPLAYGAIQGRKPSAPMGTWQGHRTKGASKIVRSAAAAAPRRESGAHGGMRAAASGGRAAKGRESKRPAVAARKARALGLPQPAKLDKKALEKKRKYSRKG